MTYQEIPNINTSYNHLKLDHEIISTKWLKNEL